MATDKEALKVHAITVRDRYRDGEITYGEARKELQEFIDVFNRAAAEIAAKYDQKPKKFSVGEFLRVGFLK